MQSTTVVQQISIPQDSPLQAALEVRSNILALTQKTENAVLKPVDCGSWSHSLRAAFAARIATHNAIPSLARHYSDMITDSSYSPVADVSDDGRALGLQQVILFMDRVALQPRDVLDTDISELQENGVSDADIVKLTEINAFMAYQVRLIAGLELLAESQV